MDDFASYESGQYGSKRQRSRDDSRLIAKVSWILLLLLLVLAVVTQYFGGGSDSTNREAVVIRVDSVVDDGMVKQTVQYRFLSPEQRVFTTWLPYQEGDNQNGQWRRGDIFSFENDEPVLKGGTDD